MERGNIEIKLANGKSVKGTGEEVYWFHKSEGRSIVAPPPDKIASTIQVKK